MTFGINIVRYTGSTATVEVGEWADEAAMRRLEKTEKVRLLHVHFPARSHENSKVIDELVAKFDWGATSAGEEFSVTATGEIARRPAPPTPHHVWNFDAGRWDEPADLTAIRADKWQEVKAARAASDFGSLQWDGSTFDIGVLSQSRLMTMVQFAMLEPAFEVDWTLANNTVRTMTANDLVALGKALAIHLMANHARAKQRREEINTATTPAAVRGVRW